MGLGVVTSFSTPASGTCVYCRRSRLVIQPVEGEAGVCDVCSYALRGAWQEAQGERLLATSPRLVKTYVLVPRLKKDRSFLDVSSYEILLDGRGQLPSVDYARSGGDLQSWLRSTYQVVTWEGATRRCYLGYDGHADFSEVVLCWAWGKVPGIGRRRQVFGTFADLFHDPTADAGFYLGVKAAFESLLWRVEATEGNRLCVVMREAALRYLECKLPGALGSDGEDDDGDDGDDEDPSMVEVYHAAASPEELNVVNLLQEAARLRREEDEAREPSAREPPTREPPARESSDQESSDQDSLGADEETSAGEVVTARPAESIPPGFARPRTAPETKVPDPSRDDEPE